MVNGYSSETSKTGFCVIRKWLRRYQNYEILGRTFVWNFYSALPEINQNKGPPHDLATLMAMFKLLCMQAQGCPNFEKVESMIASRKSDNMQRFAKAIHQKMKTNNIFRDVPERKGYFYRTT